jgi:hypothetical protein
LVPRPSRSAGRPPRLAFESSIQPLLAEHHLQCHGAEKQKGNLRLDRKFDALKGGDSGAAIVPGNAAVTLGLTMNCAQGHDHKFEPLSLRDYYARHGLFVRGQVNSLVLREPALVRAWEQALKIPDDTVKKSLGDDDTRRKESAWSGDNSGGRPHRVGALEPNPWGLYEMLGNVHECCADGWSTNVASALGTPDANMLTDPLVAPDGPDAGIVVRGASWGTHPLHCRSAFRGSAGKTQRNHRDGFRVVREASPVE